MRDGVMYNGIMYSVMRDGVMSPDREEGEDTPEVIAGVAIGDAGEVGTVYEGFVLTAGDDFNTTPTFYSGTTPTGRYAAASSTNNPTQTRRINSGEADHMIYVDPAWKGDNSQSPTSLGLSQVAVADSVLTITAANISGDTLAEYLPETYTQGGGNLWSQPRMVSARLATWPSFVLSAKGDWILEGKFRLATGQARGIWSSLWAVTNQWPLKGEFDLLEQKRDVSNNNDAWTNNISGAVDGGAASTDGFGRLEDLPDRFIHFVGKKTGTVVELWTDIASEGTLVKDAESTSTTILDRFNGAWTILMELAVNQWWDSTTWNSADWPKTYQIDWWRVWTPEGTPQAIPTRTIAQINTTPGGAYDYTLPSNATMFGSDVTPDLKEAYAAFYSSDSPGAEGSDYTIGRLPVGMTVNLGTGEISGFIPEGKGGRVGLRVLGSFDGGGAARQAILWYNVAPAVQNLFYDKEVGWNKEVDFTVRYDSFHSGDLGPHTITITDDYGEGSWINYEGNGGTNVRIYGTTPNDDHIVTFTITCTNAIGQTTQASRTISVSSAGLEYTAWNGPGWYDFSDDSAVELSGAAVIGLSNKREGGSDLVGRGNTANMVISAAAQNGLDTLALTRDVSSSANVPALVAPMKSRVSQIFQGDDKPYTVITVYKPTDTNVGFVWSASRTLANTAGAVDNIGFVRRSAAGSGVYRQRNSSTTNSVDWGSGHASGTWRVVAVKHSGTAVTVWDNSLTKAVNATSQNTAAFSKYLRFKLFGFPNNGTSSETYNLTQCNLECGEVLVEEGALSDARIEAAIAELANKWGITLS